MTPAEIAERLAELKRWRAARDGLPNYASNVRAIDAEIARLEALGAE